MSLTKKAIDAFKYTGDGASRDVRWDDAMPGFGIRIYPSGRKSFVLSYRAAGKKRLVTLGTYGCDLTLDQARQRAVKERGRLLDGADPVMQRKQDRERERTGNTFRKVAETFLARYVRKNLRQTTGSEYERIINRDLIPRWGNKRLEEITRQDVIRLLDEIEDRGSPIMANRTLAIVRKIFNWCVDRDVMEASPAAGAKAPGRERKRDRVLSDDELGLIWQTSDKMGWRLSPFVKLLILTAQRRGEVATMQWTDLSLDGDEPVWTLPREVTKADREHTVPLSSLVVEIIRSLPRMEGKYVFDTGRNTPISGFSKAKRKLDGLIGEAGAAADVWTFHDIRRTAASGMARLNIAPHILSRILNHAPGQAEGVTAIYNRHSYLPELRHALNAWAAHIERVVSDDTANNVVELAKATN
jgi:integrase